MLVMLRYVEVEKKAGWLMEKDGVRMVPHITAHEWWELSTSDPPSAEERLAQTGDKLS